MGYKQLKTIYYTDKNEYKKAYNDRIESDSCVKLTVQINENDAFYLKTSEILETEIEIHKLDKKIQKLINKLPDIALKQYEKKCLIDEIVISNDIEGVQSSRREIGDVLADMREKSSIKRFYGLVNKYAALSGTNAIEIKSNEDIRELYDTMFLDEVVSENPKNRPDGEIYRKETVFVKNSAQRVIHEGLNPEAKIINSMKTALEIANDEKTDCLIRVAVFHYLFGYIHPFYDGNGRMNRFISSCLISSELDPILSYRLSYTIKENIAAYYRAFKDVNDEKNLGDITPFVIMFMNVIKESCVGLLSGLEKRARELDVYMKSINYLPYADDNKILRLYELLTQAALFAESGISVQELMDSTSTTRTTLRRRLDQISKQGLLIMEKQATRKYYKINLNEVYDRIVKAD